MTVTTQKLRSPKNPPENIIDHTKPNWISPLQYYVETFCKGCPFEKYQCRLNDQNGLKRMELCISLYVNDPTQKAQQIFKQIATMQPPNIDPEKKLEDLEA